MKIMINIITGIAATMFLYACTKQSVSPPKYDTLKDQHTTLNQSSTTSQYEAKNIKITIREHNKSTIILEARYPNGREIKNIRYETWLDDSVNSLWRLTFDVARPSDWPYTRDKQVSKTFPGEYISPRMGAGLKGGYVQLTDREFLDLLNATLKFNPAKNENQLTSIGFELRLVKSIWDDSVQTIRNTAAKEIGQMEIKERSTMSHPLEQSLYSLSVIEKTCALLAESRYNCSKEWPVESMILFQHRFNRQNWSDVAALENVGLNEHSSIYINIE